MAEEHMYHMYSVWLRVLGFGQRPFDFSCGLSDL